MNRRKVSCWTLRDSPMASTSSDVAVRNAVLGEERARDVVAAGPGRHEEVPHQVARADPDLERLIDPDPERRGDDEQHES